MSLAVSTRAPLRDELETKKLLREARNRVTVFHQGVPQSSNVLHLVYFHPRDRKPLARWHERLERAINDVSEFYREEMERYGLRYGGVPLARRSGKPVFHLVRGSRNASAYSYESGPEVTQEVQDALSGEVVLRNNHVLVFHGLCGRNADGSLVLDVPYYGKGDNRGGVAHVADCHLLDPLMLTDTRQRIVYTEHSCARRDQHVARFNSAYLGGIAHELGHCLGLPHDAGSPLERQQRGTSLMSTGNLTYRADCWGGKNPAYLTAATMLRLVSHPLVTRSNRDRRTRVAAKLRLHIQPYGLGLRVSGTVSARIAAYGAIATVLPNTLLRNKSARDHHSDTYPAPVRDGHFTIQIPEFRSRYQHVRLSTLHLNGATQDFELISGGAFDDV